MAVEATNIEVSWGYTVGICRDHLEKKHDK
jgi:hypothetical protein